MNDDLDRKLVEAFPLLYADRNKSMMETCMYWGFETDDGWFQVIWDLSEKLEKLIKEQPEEVRSHFRASQVKEKFGELRFYMSSETKEMSDVIDEATALSLKTCETCGSAGELQTSGWWKTTCGNHEKK